MIDFITRTYKGLIFSGFLLQPLFLLVIRLVWGFGFFETGRDKLQDIDSIISYFTSLGIPYPFINAYIAATIECVGGLFLCIGLASRLVAIPLIITMMVAYYTAHHSAFVGIISDPQTFIQQTPFNYLIASLIVLIFGPGIFSIDALIKRFKRI